jgi:hypothetical protein
MQYDFHLFKLKILLHVLYQCIYFSKTIKIRNNSQGLQQIWEHISVHVIISYTSRMTSI